MAPETPPPPAGRRTARALFRRARWQQWLGRPQQALALCRQAVEHADYSRAYTLMSRLTLPGESYFGVLRRIHAHLKPATYLEIGVARGESLALALAGHDGDRHRPEPAACTAAARARADLRHHQR